MASSQDSELDAKLFDLRSFIQQGMGSPYPWHLVAGAPRKAPPVRGAVIMPLQSSACKIPKLAIGNPLSTSRGSYVAVAITWTMKGFNYNLFLE